MSDRRVYDACSETAFYFICAVLLVLIIGFAINSNPQDVDNKAQPKKVMPKAVDDGGLIPIILPDGNVGVF